MSNKECDLLEFIEVKTLTYRQAQVIRKMQSVLF